MPIFNVAVPLESGEQWDTQVEAKDRDDAFSKAKEELKAKEPMKKVDEYFLERTYGEDDWIDSKSMRRRTPGLATTARGRIP